MQYIFNVIFVNMVGALLRVFKNKTTNHADFTIIFNKALSRVSHE